jgi:hypothetical protein
MNLVVWVQDREARRRAEAGLRILVAKRPGTRVSDAGSWEEVEAVCREAPDAVVVVDPYVRGALEVELIRRVVGLGAVVVAYGDFRARAAGVDVARRKRPA